ncbi:MAG: cobalamin-dependent protein [Spirochaetes bacterium]|nr:cobalamin-dependent protein [Spirochaetota bacterium]
MSDFTGAFNEISELLQKGRAKEIVPAVEKALSSGASPADILEKGLISGMSILGAKFKNGDVFVPEVLVAARAMNQASAALKPALKEAGVEPLGTAIIATVKGDLHDIGKNLVRMMVEGKGIEVVDLGIDVPKEKIVEAVKGSEAKVLLLSALLTTTMPAMKEAIEAVNAAGLRSKVKIMVGGAPVTQGFANDIGADAYSPDAAAAAEACAGFY